MGKILVPFFLPHLVCGPVSVGFEPILKTTRPVSTHFWHVRGRPLMGYVGGLVSGRFFALPFPDSLWLVKEGCVSCVLAAVMSPKGDRCPRTAVSLPLGHLEAPCCRKERTIPGASVTSLSSAACRHAHS
jgi:hypothetical protein